MVCNATLTMRGHASFYIYIIIYEFFRFPDNSYFLTTFPFIWGSLASCACSLIYIT